MISSRFFSGRRAVAVAVLLLAGGLTAGCGGGKGGTQVEQATRENIMLVGNGAEPSDIDPQTITGIPERNITVTLFEGLTRVDPTTLDPLPGVAERWTVSPDGLTYTFYLRADAKWSDDRPLTTQDFLNSFRRILTPELGSDNADEMYPVVNAEQYHKGQLKDFAQVGFKAIDDRTLEVKLKHPASFLLKTMASRSWYPVPFHVLEKFGTPTKPGNQWTRPGNIVGNGPFVLKEWRPNQYVEVRRSPTYWNRASVKLEGVRFFPIESQVSEEAAFRAGQIHKTEAVPLNKIDVYRRDEPEKLHINPYSGVYYYVINITKPPFTDVRVRRALAMAIDRESIVKNVTRADQKPAYHFSIEGIDGYVSRARTKLDYDEARRLLTEAGFPGGKGVPPITLLYNTAENHRIIAEAVQQVWKRELGIDIRLENQEWRVFLDSLSQKNYQIGRRGLIMEPYDPSQFLKVFISSSGFNDTGWTDPEYDRLYEQVMNTVDRNQRNELMQKMEQILTDAMPVIPIYYYTNQYLLLPSVQGWSDNLLSLAPYDRAFLK